MRFNSPCWKCKEKFKCLDCAENCPDDKPIVTTGLKDTGLVLVAQVVGRYGYKGFLFDKEEYRVPSSSGVLSLDDYYDPGSEIFSRSTSLMLCNESTWQGYRVWLHNGKLYMMFHCKLYEVVMCCGEPWEVPGVTGVF